MATTTVVMVGSIAVLIFWAVGAYNRLVRLKSAIASAFVQIDAQLKHQYELIVNLVEAAKPHVGQGHETLQAILAARNVAKSAADAVRVRPTSPAAVTTLAAGEQALSSSLSQLFVWNETNPDLTSDVTIQKLREALASSENKVTFARQAFNDAVLNYNHAQGQFPALLVAKSFSFEPAATLPAT